jgi:predicted dehydrogenase
MSDKIRIGIVGAGGIARDRHIPGFKAIPDVELVGVANRTRESGERAARDYGFRKVYDRWEDLVNDPEIDAVVIGAWPYLHEPVTVAALEAGKHVLTEARMARNLAEARHMLEVAKAHPNQVAQIVPTPFTFGVEETVRAMLRDGAIGEVLEVDVEHLTGGALNPHAPLTWRQNHELSGYNVLFLGIVYENVLHWLGHVERVLADGAIYVETRPDPEHGGEVTVEIPDEISILARKGRQRQVYHLSAAHSGSHGISFELHGTEGALRIAHDQLWRASANESHWHPVEIPPERQGKWQVEADFIRSIREGAPVTMTNFETGVKYMEFVEAAWKSWKEGRAIDLPLP